SWRSVTGSGRLTAGSQWAWADLGALVRASRPRAMRCSAVRRARRHDAPKCSLSVPGGSICSDSLVRVVAAILLPVALLLMTVSTASGDFARAVRHRGDDRCPIGHAPQEISGENH